MHKLQKYCSLFSFHFISVETWIIIFRKASLISDITFHHSILYLIQPYRCTGSWHHLRMVSLWRAKVWYLVVIFCFIVLLLFQILIINDNKYKTKGRFEPEEIWCQQKRGKIKYRGIPIFRLLDYSKLPILRIKSRFPRICFSQTL